MALGIFVAIAVVAGLTAAAVRTRQRQLEAMRARWGQPVDRERQLGAIAASHRSRVAQAGAAGSLDDRTWADLNLDAVFAVLDRTDSTLGQHALYHRLRSAPVGNHLDAFEALVSRVQAHAPERERAQRALARLADPHGYDLWWLAAADAVDTRRWFAVFPLLTVATIVAAGLAPFWPQAIPALVGLLVINIVVRYLTDAKIGAVAAAFRQIAPVIATAENLRFLGTTAPGPLLDPLVHDTKLLRPLKNIARWISGDPFMLPMSAGPLAIGLNDVVSVVYEYLNLVFLLDANGVYFGTRRLLAGRAALLRVISAAGDVDAAISVASVRAGRSDWTRPRFTVPGTPAVLTDVRHPLVHDAVANSICIPAGRGVIITGSNMSGKSTFLRTAGVTAVLAQTLHTCFAGEYSAPVFVVRSCIGRSDDLLSGTSYYVAEVTALLELVEASTESPPCLFLLDELFRGTNAVERIAAGQAVLRELVDSAGRSNPHVVIAATHDSELVTLMAGSYAAHHFGDTTGPEGLVFDHLLRPGATTTRNAIALLRIHGAPEGLIRSALACAQQLDIDRGLSPPERLTKAGHMPEPAEKI